MPDSSPSFGSRLVKWIVCGFCLFVVLAALFPAMSGTPATPGRSQTKNDISQIIAASKNFYTEYGKLPPVTQDGLINSPDAQARLFRILQGNDAEANPRRIVFYEGRPASKNGRWGQGKLVGGFTPEDVLLDPWGNPYRIAFDADYDDTIKSPYEDQRDTPLRVRVIVWSLGKDGLQSPWLRKEQSRADDIVSWE